MKRLYVILFLVIAAAGVLGLAIAEHSGYVLIAYKSFRYESSLWATLALLAVLWLAFWGIKALIGLVTTSSGVVNPWSRRNRSRRVQVAIEHGQLDLAEGRWASAQRHLYRAAEAERQPLLYYLGAHVPPTNRVTTRNATTCWSAPSSASPRPSWRLP